MSRYNRKKVYTEDLYIIEDLNRSDRIKIGISKNVETRFRTIITTSGINSSDFNVIKIFKYQGEYETLLKYIFSPYNISGEWFYKEGLVNTFLEWIDNIHYLDESLVCQLFIAKKAFTDIEINPNFNLFQKQINPLFKSAIKCYESIIKERKGIGFPRSTSLTNFLRNGKIQYMHHTYYLIFENTEFKFRRKPNFRFSEATIRQNIEMLKIRRNISKSKREKDIIQSQIDYLYNENLDLIDKLLVKDFCIQLYKKANKNIINSRKKRNNNKVETLSPSLTLSFEEKIAIINGNEFLLDEEKYYFKYNDIQYAWYYKGNKDIIIDYLKINKKPFKLIN